MTASLPACVAQVTVVSLLAYVLSRSCLQRNPQRSAQLSWLGIITSVLLVVIALLEIPRPWSVGNPLPNQPVGLTASERAASLPDPDRGGLPGLAATAEGGSRLGDWLGFFRRVRNAGALRGGSVEADFGPLTAAAALMMAVVILRAGLGVAGLAHLRRTSEPLTESRCVGECAALASRLQMKPRPRLRRSGWITSPCVNWLTPGVVYVPLGFDAWSDDERAVTLAHELAHCIRRDALYRSIADLCTTALFVHPLLLLLYRQLVFAQEVATDYRAVELIGSRKRYQTALARLALRMDARRPSPRFLFDVSVSTNTVVRRIKMLSSQTSWAHRSRGWLASGVLLFCGLFAACWADEPRVAVRVSRPGAPAEAVFQRERSQPWRDIGDSSGYLQVDTAALRNHPDFQPFAPHMQEALGELSLSTIERVRTNMAMEISVIPEPDRGNGHRHRLQTTANAILVSCSEEIDWARVAEHIQWPLFASAEKSAAAREVMTARGVARELKLVPEAAQETTHPRVSELQRVWREIDGGVIGLVMAVPENLDDVTPGGDAANVIALARSIDAVGVGLDFLPDDTTRHLRIVLAPAQGTSAAEVARLLRENLARAADALRASWEDERQAATDPDGPQRAPQLLADMRQFEIIVDDTHGGQETVLLRGAIRGPWAGPWLLGQ